MKITAAFFVVLFGALAGTAVAGAAGELTPAEHPTMVAIAHTANPCHDLDWWSEQGGIEREEVEFLLAGLDCRPAQYARTAVELAHGRAGCEDISWAARTESITWDQWMRLLELYPACRPRPVSLVDRAYAAAAVGDYRTVVLLAAEQYGIPAGRFLAVAMCESHLNPDAHNPSGATGLLQHMAGLFAPRAASAGFPGASPYEPVANAFAGAYLWSVAGSGPWVQCGG